MWQYLLSFLMKNRRLWLSFAFALLAGLFGRLAWIYSRETAGVVLIVTAAVCAAVALILFAVYFRE